MPERVPERGDPPPTEDDGSDDLEAIMQKISMVVSAVGLGAMAAGFVTMAATGAPLHIPGTSAPSFRAVFAGQVPASLMAMSGGIVLLALLPAMRVLLALWLYLRNRQILNNLVALIVFLELVFSTVTGG